MRPSWPMIAVLGVLCGCGASPAEVASLRKDVERTQAQLREVRREAGRAHEEIAALNLKAEVHAFLQNDPALTSEGRFGALESRIRQATRSFVVAVPSKGPPLGLSFKTGYWLRIDFVSGAGPAGQLGNRLEVSTTTEAITPLNVQPNEYHAYVLEEGEVLELRTVVPTPPPRRARRRKGSKGKHDPTASRLFLRFLPADGATPVRTAYVRIALLGAADFGEDTIEVPAEPASDGDSMDFSVEDSD